MGNYIKLIVLGVITVLALIAANYARDVAYLVNALTVALVSAGLFLWILRRTGEPVASVDLSGEYMDGPVRAGVILTAFWGSWAFWSASQSPFNWPFRCSISNGRSLT